MLKNHIKNKENNNRSLFMLAVAFVMYSVVLVLLGLSFKRMDMTINQQAGKSMSGFKSEVIEPLGKINKDINSVLKPLLSESGVDYNSFTNKITNIENDISRTASAVQNILQSKYPNEEYLNSTLELYKELPAYIKTIVDVRKKNIDLSEESQELKELKEKNDLLEDQVRDLQKDIDICNYKLSLGGS